MKIIVPLKQVPDLVEDLEVDGSGKALDTDDIKFKLNEYDDHALEEALLLKEEGAATEVVVMAIDGDETDKMLYTALAKGADKAIKLTGDTPHDTHQLAQAFANAAKTEGCDLILAGVQSVDDRDGQLGPVLATYLGLPCISAVAGVKVQGSSVLVNKEYAGGMVAEFEMDLPGVLGIQAARQTPRYAPVSKVRQVQDSMSLATGSTGDLGAGAGSEIASMAPPEKSGSATMLDSAGDLLEILKEKGVI
ncbi:electron transfer flavoprotein subunit beta/FixA family protein [Chloroherpeton thalassium]|nr:hypothetical protein [Chloroherpeton thalassium]